MNSRYRNPHQRAFIPLILLSGLFLIATLAALGLTAIGWVDLSVVLVSAGVSALFTLILLVTWLISQIRILRAKSFLASNRPLVRWVYTPDEWQQIKEATWQEERGDWKTQWGCLAALFALVGLLTGVLIGTEDGVLQMLESGIVGLVLGGMAGSVIGAVLAAGNHLAARQAYRQSEPGEVALAPDEIYAIDSYFKGDGHTSYIRRAELDRGHPNTLQLEILVPPRPRLPSEEEWVIVIPRRLIEAVERILPLLTQLPIDQRESK